MITSVHVFETKAVVADKILDYFHLDDQSVWLMSLQSSNNVLR